jgi:hypothetical protein
MAGWKFRHNSPDLAAFLRSPEVHRMVEEAAGRIAEHAQAEVGADVEVDSTMVETDRAHGIVAVKNPRGVGIEGRTGALNRGAASVGLTVRNRRRA